ncbi:MAG TPA: peroxiredoxin-like family protein [Pseudolabrys sp.]|nr:peroxiredoxin-like family protein [Pseudolabrys sp.]
MPPPQRIPETLAQAFRDARLLDASLSQRLMNYRHHSARLRPDVASAYDALVARLDVLEQGAVGPQVGDPMPEFALPDENGAIVTLSSLLRAGPAVISINRGHWCPYCRLELHALAAQFGDIRRSGARLVSIMPDVAEFTRRFRAEQNLPFPILSDVDLGYSLLLGLVFWVGPEVRRLYEELGVDLASFQRNTSFFLPIAAKFIVDVDGTIRAREVNVEFRQRMDPAAILAALRAL